MLDALNVWRSTYLERRDSRERPERPTYVWAWTDSARTEPLGTGRLRADRSTVMSARVDRDRGPAQRPAPRHPSSRHPGTPRPGTACCCTRFKFKGSIHMATWMRPGGAGRGSASRRASAPSAPAATRWRAAVTPGKHAPRVRSANVMATDTQAQARTELRLRALASVIGSSASAARGCWSPCPQCTPWAQSAPNGPGIARRACSASSPRPRFAALTCRANWLASTASSAATCAAPSVSRVARSLSVCVSPQATPHTRSSGQRASNVTQGERYVARAGESGCWSAERSTT